MYHQTVDLDLPHVVLTFHLRRTHAYTFNVLIFNYSYSVSSNALHIVKQA
jgi:hypothetical protein